MYIYASLCKSFIEINKYNNCNGNVNMDLHFVYIIAISFRNQQCDLQNTNFT